MVASPGSLGTAIPQIFFSEDWTDLPGSTGPAPHRHKLHLGCICGESLRTTTTTDIKSIASYRGAPKETEKENLIVTIIGQEAVELWEYWCAHFLRCCRREAESSGRITMSSSLSSSAWGSVLKSLFGILSGGLGGARGTSGMSDSDGCENT
jgi:hypothetical protein